jgi:hypothetical protein
VTVGGLASGLIEDRLGMRAARAKAENVTEIS